MNKKHFEELELFLKKVQMSLCKLFVSFQKYLFVRFDKRQELIQHQLVDQIIETDVHIVCFVLYKFLRLVLQDSLRHYSMHGWVNRGNRALRKWSNRVAAMFRGQNCRDRVALHLLGVGLQLLEMEL